MDINVSIKALRGDLPGVQHASTYNFEALNRWQHSPAGSAEGAQRVRAWVQKGDLSAKLDLGQIELRSCPPLPLEVQDLSLAFNPALDTLPQPLPPGLTGLNINFCNFTRLPHDLPVGLRTLWLVTNKVTELPDTLPASLQILCATNNRIVNLPRKLPDSLRELYLATNNIVDLDPGLLSLPNCTKLFLCNNPLSDASMAMLNDRTGAEEYAGPAVKIGFVGDTIDLSKWIPASREAKIRESEGAPVIRRAGGSLAAMVSATLSANPGSAAASYSDQHRTVIQLINPRADTRNDEAGRINS
ncbi:MAG: hypothetical protein JWM30_298 [Burkholderia sp.]|jgi:phage tail protein X|nr:hypothetical protein [Burkholderia sp.]